MKLNKLKFRHRVVIIGFILATLYILATNEVLPSSEITNVLSSKYCFYLACLLVALGYFISKMETEDKYHQTDNFAPGLGEKKNVVSNKQDNIDFSDFGGGGE